MNAAAFKLELGLLDEITSLTAKLPSLPSVVRYFDDFNNEVHSIRDISSSGRILICVDGLERVIDFDAFGALSIAMKHVVVDWFQRLDPTTVVMKAANALILH
ncbi:hypothetical protein [Ensifer sp. LC163]|uniref:hypothetical protein n=1 Tax=Ensifer sp. LC163 TaxID=1120652 RepID=UPI000813AA77|nr:hypothetical protein [Ensifer sp. LC163]OCP37375.1 hypothetical protein BC360_22615 [Ensifer sp. LC163]